MGSLLFKYQNFDFWFSPSWAWGVPLAPSGCAKSKSCTKQKVTSAWVGPFHEKCRNSKILVTPGPDPPSGPIFSGRGLKVKITDRWTDRQLDTHFEHPTLLREFFCWFFMHGRMGNFQPCKISTISLREGSNKITGWQATRFKPSRFLSVLAKRP